MTTKAVRNSTNTADLTYTITDNNWQAAALPYGDGTAAEPYAYVVQAAHEALLYRKVSGSFIFQRLGDIGSLPSGYAVTDFKPNCALAAYGRIWMADIAGDPQTVYFSRLLDGSDFQGGDSGSVSLNAVFPNTDKIVAMAAHNDFLIIFGRNNIAIYNNPIDVTIMSLVDYIPNVGCVARDSVQNTGTDIIF